MHDAKEETDMGNLPVRVCYKALNLEDSKECFFCVVESCKALYSMEFRYPSVEKAILWNIGQQSFLLMLVKVKVNQCSK